MKKYHEIKNFMNTEISITVYSDEEQKTVNDLISKAFEQFDYIVKKYSRFSPTSELSIVNNQTKNPRKIDKEFYDIAKYCIDMYHLTDGVFDFTVLDLLEAIGYKNSYKAGESDEPKSVFEIKQLINSRPKVDEIILTDKPEYSISLAKNQRIEFGGCLKGYAVDLAFEVLKPLENFLIDAGGDIRVYGMSPLSKERGAQQGGRLGGVWEPWIAGLWNNSNPITETIELNSGDALACSGSAARKFANLHHLINPKSFEFEKKYSHCFLYINSHEYISNVESKTLQRLPLNSSLGIPLADSNNNPVGVEGVGGVVLNHNLCMLADTFATSAFILGEEKTKKILPKGCYAIYR